MFEMDIRAFDARIKRMAIEAKDEIGHGRYKAARALLDEIIEIEAKKNELEFQSEVRS